MGTQAAPEIADGPPGVIGEELHPLQGVDGRSAFRVQAVPKIADGPPGLDWIRAGEIGRRGFRGRSGRAEDHRRPAGPGLDPRRRDRPQGLPWALRPRRRSPTARRA